MQVLETAQGVQPGEVWYTTSPASTINQMVYTVGTTVLGASVGYVASIVIVCAVQNPSWIRYTKDVNPIVYLVYASAIFGALAGAYYGSTT